MNKLLINGLRHPSENRIGWGHQIRSYVLDQNRVKDLRTSHESFDPKSVLDGDLDGFIRASLLLENSKK